MRYILLAQTSFNSVNKSLVYYFTRTDIDRHIHHTFDIIDLRHE